MEKSNLQLSLFRGVKDTQPWPVTLDELVAMMRSDQSVRIIATLSLIHI